MIANIVISNMLVTAEERDPEPCVGAGPGPAVRVGSGAELQLGPAVGRMQSPSI